MNKLLFVPLLRFPTLIGLEKKLEDLSKDGKNLDTMGMQNALLLTLFPTQSKDFRFAADYNKNALPAYRGEWERLGWELCAHFSGYFIWRIPNHGQDPKMPQRELLTARRKKLAKSFRTCGVMFLIAALILALGIALLIANGHADKCVQILAELVAVLLVVWYFLWSSRKMKTEV